MTCPFCDDTTLGHYCPGAVVAGGPLGVQRKFVYWNGYYACAQHEQNMEPRIWCDHIPNQIATRQDIDLWSPGMNVNVPVMPESDIWATVIINDEALPNGSAQLEMVYHPDFGPAKHIYLGYWNPGEGLWSMRLVILDYIRSQIHPNEDFTKLTPILTRCPDIGHEFRAVAWMNRKGHADLKTKFKCLWNIVLEGACTFCCEQSAPGDDGLAGIDGTTAPWRPRNA